MVNFKEFLSEDNKKELDKLDNISNELDVYLNEGEIVKPEFEKIKTKLSRLIENLFDNVMSSNRKINNPINDLYYDIPHDLRTFVSFKKKILKYDNNHPLVKELKDLYAKVLPVFEKLEKLKDSVVTTKKKREDKKVEKEKELQKKFSDSSSLVKTLTKYIDEFVNKAKQKAEENYDSVIKKIDDAGGLDAIAPYPKYSEMKMGVTRYKEAIKKRDMYSYFIKTSKNDHIEKEAKLAHASYMGWVSKITEKIGKPVLQSSMTGSPWVNSKITVTTNDGEQQIWNTKMIINRSKYNLLFNQFPTRRYK